MIESPAPFLQRLEQASRAQLFLLGAFAAVVAGSALAIGSVHLEVQVALALAAGLLLWVAISHRLLVLPFPVWVLSALALWTLLQTVPLPSSIAEQLIPHQVDNWQRAFYPFRVPAPSGVSIAFDRAGAHREALIWVAYACLFAVAASLGRIFGKRIGVIIVFLSGILVAATTLAHGLVGAEKLFGFYSSPYIGGRWGASPFINPNNLSGYLNLATFCGIALVLSRRFTPYSVAVAVCTGLTMGVSILTASRGGVVTLALGLLALPIMSRWLRKTPQPQKSKFLSWIPGLAIAGGALLAILGARQETRDELFQFSSDKFRIFKWSFPLIEDHFWLGIGRGSFETVFPRYQRSLGAHIYSYAENFVVQWASEWGVPICVATLFACLWLGRRLAPAARRDPVVAVALLGVLVLAVHNFVDLALEVPAVMIAVCAVCAPVLGALTQGQRRESISWIKSLPPLGLLIFAVVLATATWAEPAASARERLHLLSEDLKAQRIGQQAFKAQLLSATELYPADPYFPLLGAIVALRSRESPMPWINVVLEKDPMNSRPHILAAQYLASRNQRRQALLELREATLRERDYLGPIAQQLAALHPSLDEAMAVAPEGPVGAMLIFHLSSILQTAHLDLAAKLVANATRLDPTNPAYRLRIASLILDLPPAQRPASLCAALSERACVDRARAALRKAEALGARREEVVPLEAALLAVADGPAAAEGFLAKQCAGQAVPTQCLWRRLVFAFQTDNADRIQSATDAYLAFQCAVDTDCALANDWIGNTFASRENWLAALDYRSRAVKLAPTSGRWLAFAEAAQRAGQTSRASAALAKLRLEELAPAQRKIAQDLRNALTAQQLE